MSFDNIISVLRAMGIKRAHIDAEAAEGFIHITFFIPRQLNFDEVVSIEEFKPVGTILTYWKLSWWENWWIKYTMTDKGIRAVRPQRQNVIQGAENG